MPDVTTADGVVRGSVADAVQVEATLVLQDFDLKVFEYKLQNLFSDLNARIQSMDDTHLCLRTFQPVLPMPSMVQE